MRILRGVSSRLLACGCLAGVYETYDGDIVTILDARGARCVDRTHEQGNLLPDSEGRTARTDVTSPTSPLE